LVAENEMVVVMPKNHRLASRPVIRPTDLRTTSVVSLPDDSPNMLHVRAAFQQAQVALDIRTVVGNSIGVCALVRQNIGVGFINPLQLSTGLFPDLVALPFRPRVVLRTLMYFSAYEPLSPAAAALAQCIKEVSQETLSAMRMPRR
jgi:DNA-binding transcriptional LysR family regulator